MTQTPGQTLQPHAPPAQWPPASRARTAAAIVATLFLACVSRDTETAPEPPAASEPGDAAIASATADLPVFTVDRLELLAQLAAGDYAGLEAAVGGALTAARVDLATEPDAQLALATFSTLRPEVGDQLRDWVEQHAESPNARLAYAVHLVGRAWQERGTAYARETSAAQFAGMERYFAAAEEQLAAALELDAASLEAHLLLHGIARTRGADKAMRRIERRALEIAPASYRLRWALLAGRTPRWGGSYRALDRFVAETQQWVEENPRLTILRGYPEWERGSMAALAERHERALEHFDAAIAEGESNAYYLDRAIAKGRLDDDAGAVADLDRALELYPQNPRALLQRAERLSDLGEFDRAFADLARADALDPTIDHAPPTQHYVAQRAVQAASKRITRGPAQDLEHATELLHRAGEWDPNDAWLLFNRGRLSAARRDDDAAEAGFRTCIEAHPDFFECYRSIDAVLARRGAWDEIAAHWDRFLALEPNHADAYLERAGTHRRRNDRAAALDDLRRACDLGNRQACAILQRETGG